MKLKALLLSVMLTVALTAVSHATVLDFENVPGAVASTDNNPIPSGYGGLNWSNMYVLNGGLYPGSGYQHGQTTPSGSWVAFNAFGSMAVTSGGSNFSFDGAYFTAAWNNNVLFVQGFDDGVLVDTASLALNTTAPVWLDADFASIDTLQFFTNDSTWFAMDDFTMNQTAPVPEPGTILLLAGGFIGLAAFRKRHKKA